MLFSRGVAMARKPFAMGLRIEHPQDVVDLIQYGELSTACGVMPADYKQAHLASNGRGIYTFCMCPGGEVIACSSEPGGVVTNGMSRYKRASGFANSGLVVQTHPADFAGEEGPEVLRGVAFQRRVERAAFAAGGGTYAARRSASPTSSRGAQRGRCRAGPTRPPASRAGRSKGSCEVSIRTSSVS